MTPGVPWRPSAAGSADLMRGYRAARELQRLSVPPMLAKQVANYLSRVNAELAQRGIHAAKVTGETPQQPHPGT
jgi:hypothetical protein